MKCPECGTEVGIDEKFCGNCGAPLESAAAPSEEPEAALGGETILSETPAPATAPEEPEEEPELIPPPPPPSPPLPEEGEFIPPPPPPPPPTPVAGSEKKNQTTLIVVIVIVVLVLLCCCCLVVGIAVNWEAIEEAMAEVSLIAPALTPLL